MYNVCKSITTSMLRYKYRTIKYIMIIYYNIQYKPEIYDLSQY